MLRNVFSIAIIAGLAFGVVSTSLAYDNEESCRRTCWNTFDERGAMEACGVGCDWHIGTNLSVGQCENQCTEVFSQRGDFYVAQEKIIACVSGCNI